MAKKPPIAFIFDVVPTTTLSYYDYSGYESYLNKNLTQHGLEHDVFISYTNISEYNSHELSII